MTPEERIALQTKEAQLVAAAKRGHTAEARNDLFAFWREKRKRMVGEWNK